MNNVLIFPPLVNTNFGNYYPSLSVLAGHLHHNGSEVSQHDFNEEFAEYLLSDYVLDNIIQKKFDFIADKPDSSILFKAARILKKNKQLLYSSDGRHLFREDQHSISHLLQEISKPFIIDEEINQNFDYSYLSSLESFYHQFYDKTISNLDLELNSIIGISVPMGAQIFPTIFLCKLLKKHNSHVKIICGGPALSLMDSVTIESFLRIGHEIDVVVKYDGEQALLDLIEQRNSNNWLSEQVPSTSYICKHSDTFFDIPPSNSIKLDSLAFAKYDEKILSKLKDPEFGIIQARGCYWGKCSYCDFVELYKGAPKYRTKTVSKFVNEIEYQIENHGANNFAIITESIPPAFAKKFSQEILRRNIKIKWNSFAMVHDLFDSETFQLMNSSGCDYLVIGLESMDTNALRNVLKASDREENINFINQAYNNNIDLRINIIPNLPMMTKLDSLKSLEQLSELKDKIFSLAIFPFEVTKSSEIGRTPEKFGLKIADIDAQSAQAQYKNNNLPVIDEYMSTNELDEVIKEHEILANEINSKSFFKKKETQINSVYISHYLKLDIAQTIDNNTIIYNPISRSSFILSKQWHELISLTSKLFPCSKNDFLNKFPNKLEGETLFNILNNNGIIQSI
jgi:hypothetical protein